MNDNDPGKRAQTGRERRRFTRVALDAHVSVTVLDTNTLFTSRVRDLSENGVFIMTQSTRPIGTGIRLFISVEEGKLSLEARGIIVHEVPADRATSDRPAGIGVMFTELNAETRRRLRTLVAARAPLP